MGKNFVDVNLLTWTIPGPFTPLFIPAVFLCELFSKSARYLVNMISRICRTNNSHFLERTKTTT